MYIRSLRGDLVSLWVETREQLNPIDFRRPIEVIVSGPDGQVTSDSHSRTIGVNLQGGNRLPATTAPGRKCLNGRDHNGLPPTRRTLKGSEYESDREWHLRNMHYGEGWACDSTQSHSKRAKPTYTDPEDDRMTDSSLPIGSTSKTYDPEKQCDRGQSWSYSSSSSGQWRPRLWHERAISSAAGDTSDASNAVHHLRSIHEDDSDAVRASSEWKNQWW